MRKRFTAFSKYVAVLFAILFTISTVLVILLLSFQATLLDAETYKRLLAEKKVYEQLPTLIAQHSGSLRRLLGDPCLDTPLVCAIDGASPQLQGCLTDALGEVAYSEIGSGRRNPTRAELQNSQLCLDQYGQSEPPLTLLSESPDEDYLAAASAEVQACARERLGDETYAELYSGQRVPTRRETRRINACIRQERRNARLNYPGIGADLMPVVEGLSTEQWEGLIRFLLPGESRRRMTESTLDQAFAYLDGETERVTVSIVDLKARLTGRAGEDLILFLLEAQPSCTAEQTAQIDAGGFENGGGTAVYCAASGETLAKMIPGMRIRLEKVHAELPDEVILIQSATSDGPDGLIRRDRLTALRAARYWLRFSPLVPLSLLLLVTVFGVRSATGWLRWWGIPLLIAGLIGLGIGIAAQPLVDWARINFAAVNFPPILSSGLGELGHELSRSLARELGQAIILTAGLVALLGLAMLLLSTRLRSKPDHTPRTFLPPELGLGSESLGDVPSGHRGNTCYFPSEEITPVAGVSLCNYMISKSRNDQKKPETGRSSTPPKERK